MQKYCPKCFNKFPAGTMRCPHDGKKLIALIERDLIGEELDDRYLIKSIIGKGGMGVVYMAEQMMLGRNVALKVLRRDVVQDEDAVKRFMREAKVIAQLRSPHTVTLHDFGVSDDGLVYYTMELLEGRTLSRVLREEGPLPHKRAAGIVLQACESLEEAHNRGILHRDIKPDNLFVTEFKGHEHVIVLDFGIAKLLGDSAAEAITKTGMVCGTPEYLSPEQAMGVPAVKASDLYSLSIVLYELLAGEPPFRDTTMMKVLMKHLNEEPAPVRTKNPDVEIPESLEAFLKKALAKEAEQRYGTVEAYRKALTEALDHQEKHPSMVAIPPIQTTADGLRGITSDYAGSGEKDTPPTTPLDLSPMTQPVESSAAFDATQVADLIEQSEPATPMNGRLPEEDGVTSSPGILSEEDPVVTPSVAALIPGRNKIWIAMGLLAATAVAVVLITDFGSINSGSPQEETSHTENEAATAAAGADPARTTTDSMDIRSEPETRKEALDSTTHDTLQDLNDELPSPAPDPADVVSQDLSTGPTHPDVTDADSQAPSPDIKPADDAGTAAATDIATDAHVDLNEPPAAKKPRKKSSKKGKEGHTEGGAASAEITLPVTSESAITDRGDDESAKPITPKAKEDDGEFRRLRLDKPAAPREESNETPETSDDDSKGGFRRLGDDG